MRRAIEPGSTRSACADHISIIPLSDTIITARQATVRVGKSKTPSAETCRAFYMKKRIGDHEESIYFLLGMGSLRQMMVRHTRCVSEVNTQEMG